MEKGRFHTFPAMEFCSKSHKTFIVFWKSCYLFAT